MKVDAVVRARMGSSRLPGKALFEAAGKSMLELTIERVAASRLVGRVVVATTELAEDDTIEAHCDAIEVPCVRGSVDDVLGRVHACAVAFGMRHVAHFGADNPLVAPAVCDDVIAAYFDGEWDYVTNNFPPSYPDGLEVEVTAFATLDRLAREATLSDEREHFLLHLWRHPERFAVRNVAIEPSLHHERWTLDYLDDWALVRSIFEELHAANPRFGIDEILALLERRPELRRLNAAHAGDYAWRTA